MLGFIELNHNENNVQIIYYPSKWKKKEEDNIVGS